MDRNFRRLLDTLQLLQRKRKATTAELHQALQAMGHKVTLRTLQRDLESLATEFNIERDDRDKGYAWSWPSKAVTPLTPHMDTPQALAFLLLEREMGSLLPATVRNALTPWLEQARTTLSAAHASSSTRWQKKIAFRPVGPPLLPAPENRHTMEAIADALFRERQVSAQYRSFAQSDARPVKLHPLGLVRTGLVTYLVACFDGYAEPRLLAMHRLKRVRVLTEPMSVPAGFDLNAFLDGGGFNFGQGPTTTVRLRMTTGAAHHLYDTPLSRDQTIQPLDADRVLVTATVFDSPRLAWWLRGFGEDAERLP
jgi:predicted DNA-binding transcriptional regulator YafY